MRCRCRRSLGLRKARLIAGDGTDEEKRERLEKTPISVVVEGEAFSVFYPDTKVRRTEPASSPPGSRMWGQASNDRQAQLQRQQQEEEEAYSEPEALLLRETFFELASMAKSVIAVRLTPAQKGKIVKEFVDRGHVTLAIGDGGQSHTPSHAHIHTYLHTCARNTHTHTRRIKQCRLIAC